MDIEPFPYTPMAHCEDPSPGASRSVHDFAPGYALETNGTRGEPPAWSRHTMVFASNVFLYVFLPAFLAIYYLLPRGWRSLAIAVASYVFYGWWRPDFLILMWASTVCDYVCGKKISAARKRASADGDGDGDDVPPKTGKPWLLVSIFLNLGLLGYFKYADFGIESLNVLLAAMGEPTLDVIGVVLPVGISFYTFQTLSYTIDVYRGQAEEVRSFRDFMCYVALFPQLVAGPIVRYRTIAEQLHTRTHTFPKFYRGLLAFQSGLAKKVLVADVLGELSTQAFAAADPHPVYAWIGVVAYTLQIYFDFSGYSDMAIGLGLMLGFRFPINFDRPYCSASITELWRRWHISLSSFLRDYLYIPLGGNRLGPLRTYFNLGTTMVLGGLWHGAAWTYLLWGAYQGFWLIVERLAGRRPFYSGLPRPLAIAATFLIIVLGFVPFRAENLEHSGRYFAAMIGQGGADTFALRPIHGLAAVAAVVIVWGLPTTQTLIIRARALWVLPLQVAFVLAILHLHFVSHVPFLYFQF